MRTLMLLAVGLLGVSMTGCGPAKLNVTKNFSIPDADKMAEIYIMPAQKADQNVNVAITADQPVDVYIILTKDLADAENKLPAEWAKAAIASKKGAKSDTLTGKIPANQEWKLVVTTGLQMKKASGSVKITN